jgi:hypothetical protein
LAAEGAAVVAGDLKGYSPAAPLAIALQSQRVLLVVNNCAVEQVVGDANLAGSVPLDSAETVLRTAADMFCAYLRIDRALSPVGWR